MKSVFQLLLTLILLGLNNVKAQYYLDKSGDLTTDMKKAYYSRKVTPEFKDGRRQYVFLEKFANNDQVKTKGVSLTDKAPYAFVGKKETYYPNGKLKSTETFSDRALLIDTAYYYYPSGTLYLKTHNNGREEQFSKYNTSTTRYILYYDSLGIKRLEHGNGFLRLTNLENEDYEEGALVSNKREGEWIGKSSDSPKKSYTFKEYYEKGHLIRGEKIKNNGKIIFYDSTNYQTNPIYSEGMDNFMRFIAENYKYPIDAMKNGVNGIVHISFIVEKDGSLSNIKIQKDLGYGTGAAGVEVIKKSKKWIPGTLRGEPVRIAYTLPIRLNLR